MPIKIVIADDYDIIRAGIRSVLGGEAGYFICAEAANGEEAIERVREFKPDILLLDISMPKVGGLDIISRIKRISPETKIIIISVYKLGAYVLKALRSGVEGYLNKDNVVEELIPALKRVSAGKTYLGATVSDYLAQMVKDPQKKETPYADILNGRELDVLRLVAEGKTAKEVAGTLFLSRRTIENYKNSILKKLNLHKTSDLIKYAIEHKIISVKE